MDSGLVDCGIEPGQRIWVTLGTADRLTGCFVPDGVIFSFSYNEDKPMDPVALEASAPVAEAPVTPPAVEAPATDAHTEVPAAPPDLSQLEGLAGGNPMLMAFLAVLVVVGGTAGWKFWSGLSEQKHEQKMKALELEAQKAGLGAAQPPPCQVKQVEVDAKLADVAARLAAVEKKSATMSADFDGDELERQVKKLGKAVKALQEQSNA